MNENVASDDTSAPDADYGAPVPTDPAPNTNPRRLRTWCRRLGVAAALALGASTVAAVGPTAPEASAGGLPVLAVSCHSTTYGFVGQPVTLSPLAIIGTVKEAAGHAHGLPGNADSRIGWDFGPKLPFTIGKISKYSETEISGEQIADSVVDEVKGYDEIKPATDAFAEQLHKRMDGKCGLTAKAWNGSGKAPTDSGSTTGGGSDSSPSDSAGSDIPPPSSGNGAGSALPSLAPSGNSDRGTVPRRDYSDVPAATPGGFAASPASKYGQVPGAHAPDVEMLGANGKGERDGGVRAAGRARALGHAGTPGDPVGLPLLLAVLALAGVTGALLRTWVLRKSAADPS